MFKEVFHGRKPVIGMVHLKALPGSPAYRGNWEEILHAALKDAKALYEGGVDGLQIENQFDRPFLKTEQIGPETTAFLTAAGCAVKDRYPELPLGINVHLNGGIQAIAAAKACGAQWIRVFHLANAYISNSGYVDALGPKLLRYRREIDAEQIMIFGDFQVKHGSHAITADRPVAEKALDIEVSMGDAAIITGDATGLPPDRDVIERVKEHITIPLLIGSGLNERNLSELWPVADGAIIGSGFKPGGRLEAPVDEESVKRFIEVMKGADRKHDEENISHDCR